MRAIAYAKPLNPYQMITNPDDLERISSSLAEEPFVGLDVETTLRDHAVCLVQISTIERTHVFDALRRTMPRLKLAPPR